MNDNMENAVVHGDAVSSNQAIGTDIVLSQYDIEKMIFTIRGEQVLIDRDLAYIYQVEVKQMNRQVKRNIERFPDDFMFQLSKEEYDSLKYHFGTSNKRGGYRRALPYAFTVSDLVRSAKQRVVLIDNFVDDRVLSLLDKRGEHVDATIHTRFSNPFQTDLNKHNAQCREIKFVQLPHRNHDRFFIVDDAVYLLGASVKDMGVGMCAITKMEAMPETILEMLK